MTAPRIFFAGLFHESHSFLSEGTELSDFKMAGYGTAVPIEVPGSPMAAAVELARESGTTWYAGPYFYAMPSGPAAPAVLEHWQAQFSAAWDQFGPSSDGIFLVLHGAMVTETDSDVEASLLAWIRSLPHAADIPIHVVLDLHGNISQSFVEKVNCLVAYQKNPHTDAGEAARKSLQLLTQRAHGSGALKSHWAGTRIVWPPSGTGTADEPMRSLEAAARAIETRDGIQAVNVFAGYSYADTYDTGVSFSLVADPSISDQAAQAALRELTQLAEQTRELGIPQLHDQSALNHALAQPQHGPVLVAEPADNIGAGAPGDCTALLRIFLQHQIQGAAVIINDPQAVQELMPHAHGDKVHISIGGKGSALDQGPLEAEVELLRCFDGRFQLEDPKSHLASMLGTQADMGPCALVQLDGTTLLLTSEKTPPFDLGQWRVAGINPQDFRVIGVKAAVAYRQAYDPIASAHLTLDTAGPCQINLSEISYRHIRRPVYPLDTINIMNTKTNPTELLEGLYAAVVADVLDTLGYKKQTLDAAIRPLTPTQRVAGRVFSAKAVTIDTIPDEPYKLEMAAIDAMQAGDVLVCDTEYDKTCGFWGELLTTACMYKGIQGVVMTACTRDMWKIRELDFPVFGIGYHPADSKGRADIISINEPITIGGVETKTGDLILGDEDGTVIIPAEIQAEALRMAREKIAGENIVRDELANGMPITEAFAKYGIL